MWNQFKDGVCVSTSSYPITPMAGVVSVWCDKVYTDLENLRLVDGKVVHVEPEEMGDIDGTDISS